MTPAQEKALAVALDGLREAFGDEVPARVARSIDGRIERAVVRYMTALEDPSPVDYPADHAQVIEYDAARVELREMAILIDCATFLAAEKPTAASAHRPEAETVQLHATAQAIEGLARYRNGCKAAPFVRACDGQEADGAIIEAEAMVGERLPTCPRCLVLWNEALIGTPPASAPPHDPNRAG